MKKENGNARAPFESLLNIHIHEAEAGSATLSMPFLPQLAQGAGLMHGGALLSLADTAMAMAIKGLVPPGTHFVTIEARTRFLAPVHRGTVTAKARITHQQGRDFSGHADVEDEQGRDVLYFEARFKLARRE